MATAATPENPDGSCSLPHQPGAPRPSRGSRSRATRFQSTALADGGHAGREPIIRSRPEIPLRPGARRTGMLPAIKPPDIYQDRSLNPDRTPGICRGANNQPTPIREMNDQTTSESPSAACHCSASRLTPEGRRRVSESSKRTYRDGRLHRQDRATLQRMWKKSNEVTRGTNGFGRQARGRTDHGRALVWTIQAPDGETWTAANLLEWCRQNEDMFPKYPGAKMPTAKRAADGLMTAYRRQLTWYGWSIISCEPNSGISSGREGAEIGRIRQGKCWRSSQRPHHPCFARMITDCEYSGLV